MESAYPLKMKGVAMGKGTLPFVKTRIVDGQNGNSTWKKQGEREPGTLHVPGRAERKERGRAVVYVSCLERREKPEEISRKIQRGGLPFFLRGGRS